MSLHVLEFHLPRDFLSILAAIPGFRNTTGHPVLSVRSESVPHMSAFALFSLSLDTVVVGEVDELEEDVG